MEYGFYFNSTHEALILFNGNGNLVFSDLVKILNSSCSIFTTISSLILNNMRIKCNQKEALFQFFP